jgi:hypothetical protein
MRFIDEMIDRKRREAARAPQEADRRPETGAPPDFDRDDLPPPLDWPRPPHASPTSHRDTTERAGEAAPVSRTAGRPGDASRQPSQPGRRRYTRPPSETAPEALDAPGPADQRAPEDDAAGPDLGSPMEDLAGPVKPARQKTRPRGSVPLRLVDPIQASDGAAGDEEGDHDAPAAIPPVRAPETGADPAGVAQPAADAASSTGSQDGRAAAPSAASGERPLGYRRESTDPAEAPLAPDTVTSPSAWPEPTEQPSAAEAEEQVSAWQGAPGTAEAQQPRPTGPAGTGRAKTRLLGFRAPEESEDVLARAGAPAAAAAPARFPVGWLVIERGPGRGAAFALSDGLSTVGRGTGQTVQLDFGDTAISRDTHAAIAYDDESRACFLGHGGKANLVRRNGRPVLTTEAIEHGDRIRLGETTLRFVALCGPEFSWSDAAEEESPDAATR